MRVIGMDIHRTFAEAVMIDGDKLIRLGRVTMSRDHLSAFAGRLTQEDHIVIEATGNAQAVAEAIAPFVGRVAIANLKQVHLIAKARIKTDVIDATVLARLYASGFLPEVWVPDQQTMSLRRQVTRRNQVVRQRGRLKTMVQASCMPISCRNAHMRIYRARKAVRGCWRRFCRTMRAPRSNGIYANMID